MLPPIEVTIQLGLVILFSGLKFYKSNDMKYPLIVNLTSIFSR